MAETSIEWVISPDGSQGHTVNPIRFRNLETGKIGHHCEAITAALAGKATVKESVTVEVCRCDRDDNGTWRGTCKCAKSVAESTRLGWLDAANFLETLGQFSYARALRREAGVVEIENG